MSDGKWKNLSFLAISHLPFFHQAGFFQRPVNLRDERVVTNGPRSSSLIMEGVAE
jgi:hypothetical protein